MSKPSNEQLCALAQKGDTHATNLLLEYNSGFIRKTANEIFLKSNLVESDLSIEIGDLEQEGSIGLLKAIPSYDKSVGVKFLTYAAPFIRNAMTDLVRDSFSRYEQRMVDPENGLGLQKVRLDEVLPGEERLLRIEAVADITAKSPEQVYEEREIPKMQRISRLKSRKNCPNYFHFTLFRQSAALVKTERKIILCLHLSLISLT